MKRTAPVKKKEQYRAIIVKPGGELLCFANNDYVKIECCYPDSEVKYKICTSRCKKVKVTNDFVENCFIRMKRKKEN